MIRYNEAMIKYNNILLQFSKLQIVKFDKDGIVLSNGVVLNTKVEKNKFVKRLKKDSYHIYFDNLYSVDKNVQIETFKQIKRDNGKRTGGLAWVNNREKLYNMVINNLQRARENGNAYKHIKENGSWCKGLTKETSDIIKRMSENKTGEKNPLYGKHLADDTRKKQSETIKKKILSGEFTPNIHNRLTHYSCTINNMKYRSSWEGYFSLLNPSYEYEKLRIPYTYKNKEKIYIVDFISEKDKKTVEIKPKMLFNNEKSICKEKALIKWCNDNGYSYERITEDYILEHYDENIISLLDERNQNNIRKVKLNENKKY